MYTFFFFNSAYIYTINQANSNLDYIFWISCLLTSFLHFFFFFVCYYLQIDSIPRCTFAIQIQSYQQPLTNITTALALQQFSHWWKKALLNAFFKIIVIRAPFFKWEINKNKKLIPTFIKDILQIICKIIFILFKKIYYFHISKIRKSEKNFL